MLLAVAGLAFGCGRRGLEDTDEIAQNAGEVLASLDEVSQSGAIAQRMFPREPSLLRPRAIERALGWVLPEALAATSCWTVPFSACASGTRTRDFNSCSIGPATLTGTVKLTFSDTAGCKVETAGAAVTRTPDFTLTGPRGASYKVTAPGGGQTVTKAASGYTYKVGGIQRVGTSSGGATLFDFTTKTLEDITITGTSRAERVLNGGKLEVTNSKRNYTVVLAPENLKWSATCSCPVSGKLTGSVTSGGSGTVTIEVTGCGTAKLTVQGETSDVTLERCSSL
ncbi:MAG: hypothetical protein HYZ28_04935 [Myxococcales bacterium]|nr:hypothetical protein [Myxococcales bacterium]